MNTDESIAVNGKTITARDLPRGEFGVYRHYEVDSGDGKEPVKFALLEDAQAFCGQPAKPVPTPDPATVPADTATEPQSTTPLNPVQAAASELEAVTTGGK